MADPITLKDYLIAKLDAQEKAMNLARENLERRLEGMKEFRNQLKDQSARFLTRDEYVFAHDKVIADIRTLLQAKDILAGKASMSHIYISWLMGVAAILVSILALYH